jgi:hypothetical protein
VVSCATRGPSPSFPWASLGLPSGFPWVTTAALRRHDMGASSDVKALVHLLMEPVEE